MLSLGVFGTSRKENELRLPIHPRHLDRIDEELRRSIYLEEGYAGHFGLTTSEIEGLVAGVRSQDELIEQCDVILLPKPLATDVARMREGQVLWGWPHCVQDPELTQEAVDHRATLIAWEAMNHWGEDGSFGLHVFHQNNELAGYCSVLHALRLVGLTGEYGRPLTAAIISYGATGRGAVTALQALDIREITVMTHREPSAVESPPHGVTMAQFKAADGGRVSVVTDEGDKRMAEVLAQHDIVVNCVLQDTDAPYMFVTNDELNTFDRGTLIVDVSCDEGMGFEWARPTSFEDPMFVVGDQIHYYAVDHSPSYLWDSATWEISEALLPYLRTVMTGPEAWETEETIRRAIEIRNGVIQNPKILSFQDRAEAYPHPINR